MVKDLLGSDTNTFVSLEDFCLKYQLDPRLLSFYGLILAVKALRSKSNFQDVQNTNCDHEPLTNRTLQGRKATTLVYSKLISNKSLTPELSQNKWLEDCNLLIKENI